MAGDGHGCDRLPLLDKGRLVAEGAPEAVLTPEILARVYGVTAHFARDDGGLVVAQRDLAR